jgi:histidinol-phosphate/aromatic aminotransferase/cobyric acid decarboxylase-like protein
VIRRLRDYYRQFEELSPEEISRGLRERRDADRATALTRVQPLDLRGAAWHEPPDAEAVNAATYALRRAINHYADDRELRDALAVRHGVDALRVVPGHGAGELLHAAFRAIGPGRIAIAWPGWSPLPRLVHEAGGTPVPVPYEEPEVDAHAIVVCSPNDPTGATIDLRALAERLPEPTWLVFDQALAELAPDTDVGAVLDARERILVVRSFSKAHAMAGLRAGYALANDAELLDRLSPAGGISAPAQAAMLWGARGGEPLVGRRRATAARQRERLADALRGTPFAFAAGHGHLLWLASTEEDGAALARRLAAQHIYVTPGAAWGDEQHVRVALRDDAATDRLVAALLS